MSGARLGAENKQRSTRLINRDLQKRKVRDRAIKRGKKAGLREDLLMGKALFIEPV